MPFLSLRQGPVPASGKRPWFFSQSTALFVVWGSSGGMTIPLFWSTTSSGLSPPVSAPAALTGPVFMFQFFVFSAFFLFFSLLPLFYKKRKQFYTKYFFYLYKHMLHLYLLQSLYIPYFLQFSPI